MTAYTLYRDDRDQHMRVYKNTDSNPAMTAGKLVWLLSQLPQDTHVYIITQYEGSSDYYGIRPSDVDYDEEHGEVRLG